MKMTSRRAVVEMDLGVLHQSMGGHRKRTVQQKQPHRQWKSGMKQ